MASITQRRETESLLFDQQECVTVGRLATRLHLSRTDAGQLLSSILHDHQPPPPNNNNNNALVVETTTVESCAREVPCSGANNKEQGETVPCTVFSLRTKQEKLGSKEEENDETDDKDQPRFVYALSPVLNHNKNDESTAAMSLDHHGSSSTVASMHEQTLAVWRDMIRQRDTGQLQACVAQAQDMVQAPLSCDEARWAQFQTPSTDLGSVTVSHRSGSAAAGKKKDVTAKAFFGSSKASSSSATAAAAAATAKASSSAKSGATMAKSKKPAKASVRSATTKKQSTKSNSGTAAKTTSTSALSSAFAKQRTIAEKENKNKQHREKSNAKIGTADDFVGDLEDSDDDDDDSVAKVVDPPNNAAGKTKIDNDVEMMQVDEEEEGDDPVPKQKHEEEDKQPMEIDNDDDNKEEDAPPQKRRARRKKLEQVTSMDQKGFLVTETKVVWEDVPSDEEEKSSKATSAKPKPKKKANTGKAPKMKQKSLSSFFKK